MRGGCSRFLSVLRGSHEPFVTLTDSDVLFRPGWLERTVEVFSAFPEVGAVSALPVPHLRRVCTSTTYLGAAFRGLLRVGSFAREEDLAQYMTDLESPRLISEPLLKVQPAIVRQGVAALIGCTHMQCTYRRAALERAPKEKCTAAMGRDSEYRWMDLPPEDGGWWKVSLPEAYVRHMGNRLPRDIPVDWQMRRPPMVHRPPNQVRPPEGWLPAPVRRIGGRIVQQLVEWRLRKG